jgi:hypothetical protein
LSTFPIETVQIISGVWQRLETHQLEIKKAIFEQTAKTLLSIGKLAVEKNCEIGLKWGNVSVVLNSGGKKKLKIFQLGAENWEVPDVDVTNEESIRTFLIKYGEGTNYNYFDLVECILERAGKISIEPLEK